MLVESGLVLALQAEKVKSGGGVWTPAACHGELLTRRLVSTGCELSMEVVTENKQHSLKSTKKNI